MFIQVNIMPHRTLHSPASIASGLQIDVIESSQCAVLWNVFSETSVWRRHTLCSRLITARVFIYYNWAVKCCTAQAATTLLLVLVLADISLYLLSVALRETIQRERIWTDWKDDVLWLIASCQWPMGLLLRVSVTYCNKVSCRPMASF